MNESETSEQIENQSQTSERFEYDFFRFNTADIVLGNTPNLQNNAELLIRGMHERKRDSLSISKTLQTEKAINLFGEESLESGDGEGVKTALNAAVVNSPLKHRQTVLEESVADSLQNRVSEDSIESTWLEANPELGDLHNQLLIAQQIADEHIVKPIIEENQIEGILDVGEIIFDFASFIVPFYEQLVTGDFNLSGEEERRDVLFSIMKADDKVEEAKKWKKRFEDSGLLFGNGLISIDRASNVSVGRSSRDTGLRTLGVGIDTLSLGSSVVPRLTRALRVVGARSSSADVATTNLLKANPSAEEVEEILPSILSYKDLPLSNPLPNVSTSVQQRLQKVDELIDEFFEGAQVDRLNPEQIGEAIRVAKDEAFSEFGEFADVVITREKNTQLHRVTFFVGQPENRARGFSSLEAAERAAKEIYNFDDFQVKDGVGGYFITVDRGISETSPTVAAKGKRDLKDFQSNVPLGRFILGADNFMDTPSIEAAHLTTSGYARYRKILSQVAREANKSVGGLKLKQRQAVKTLIKEGQEREKWFTSSQEMADVLKREPTENEIAAYLTYRKINDLDYMVRNIEASIEKNRRGYSRVSFSTPETGITISCGKF